MVKIKIKFILPVSYFILPFLFLAININSDCQSKQNIFKHLTSEDGLSSSNVLSLLLDHQGYMWIGTSDGLNRFDGTKFVVYKNSQTDSTSIESNVIFMFEDHEKNLFLGTSVGLSLYNRNLNCFVNFGKNKKSALYKFNYGIYGISEDTRGNLWLGTNKGLICFNYHKNLMTKYQHNPADPGSISDNYTEMPYVDSKCRIWISTHKGLDFLDNNSGKFIHITKCKTHNEDISSVFFHCIKEDKTGNIWFGSNKGLFCLENTVEKGKQQTLELQHYQHIADNPNSLSHNYVISLFVDDNNNLWVGTENGGINFLDQTYKTFTQIRKDDINPMSLNNESIHSFAMDNSNNLWIGTYGGGINLKIKNSEYITTYKNLPGVPFSLSHNIVDGFLEDNKGRIWVATDGGGFNLFNEKKGQFVRFTMSNSNINSNAVLCLTQGKGDDIWMGTWAGGLVKFNVITNSFKSYTTKNSLISDDNIHCVTSDNNGNLWLGSQNGGLIYFRTKEEIFRIYRPNNSKISNVRISVIKIDSHDQLYIGSASNLQIFDPVKNLSKIYTSISTDSTSLSYPGITDILIQNDTCVWIGTESGLNLFNPLTQKFKRYFIKDGLPNNYINGLALDKSGYLWISTNNGLSRFNNKNKTFRNFNKTDGLQGNEFSINSLYITKNGNILAGGKFGFNIINPDNIAINTKIPTVVITDFLIFNQPVKIGAPGSPLTKQISETTRIIIKHDQSVLSFNFTVMDFTNPQKNQFAYMMENFDKGWIYCGSRKEATYTNLNPGKYIFKVKGSNNDGIWNEKGTSLEIIIKPPWWQTPFSTILFIFIFICIIISIYLFRTNELRKQKDLLEKLVDVRTAELAQKNETVIRANLLLSAHQKEIEEKNTMLLEQSKLLNELNTTKDKLFSIISHDLINPFNSIMGYSELLLSNLKNYSFEKIENQLTQIKSVAKNTFYLLNNLLAWSRSQQDSIQINPGQLKVEELLEREIDLLVEQANIKNIQLVVTSEGKESNLFADPDLMSTVIRNLISNAIKFSNKGQKIWIQLQYKPESFTFSVKDEGVGMDSTKVESLFKYSSNASTKGTTGEKGTGLGLLLCADFIEKHKGHLWVQSKIGEGSTFSFSIPLNQLQVNT